MRPLIIVGLAITAVVAVASMGLLLLLLAAIILSTSSSSGDTAELGSYQGSYSGESASYGGYSAPYDNVLQGNPQPLDRSPADPWLNGNEFSGRMSGGTFDDSGEGNHVISVGGEVLNLP